MFCLGHYIETLKLNKGGCFDEISIRNICSIAHFDFNGIQICLLRLFGKPVKRNTLYLLVLLIFFALKFVFKVHDNLPPIFWPYLCPVRSHNTQTNSNYMIDFAIGAVQCFFL